MEGKTSQIVRPGEQVPDIRLPRLDEGQIGLRDFLGKRLVVFVWASW
ncbi:MAG: redoxin domain-containing protein, partial [Chloroflexi bacterium]|nr:redoxin domain-containing protein [Chloroflexota bacterium]